MCIHRDYMPQIDIADLEILLDFAKQCGCSVTFEYGLAYLFKPIQCMPRFSAPVERATLRKPILVSADNYILDGHHRWATWRRLGRPLPLYRLGYEKSHALGLLFAFPKTYAYGDGAFHPCKI